MTRHVPTRHPLAARMADEADLIVDGLPGEAVYRLIARTTAAQEWCDEHIDPHAERLGAAILVEHRYVWPIVDGARADGLRVFVGRYYTASRRLRAV